MGSKRKIRRKRSSTSHFRDKLQRAEALQQSGRAREAATLFQQLTTIAPTDVSVWAGWGMALHDLGELEASESAFYRTVQLNPKLSSAHMVRGGVLRQLGRLSEAKRALQTAISIKPSSAGAHANLGLVQIDEGRLSEARSTLRTALAIDPTNTHAIIALASLTRAKPADSTFETLKRLTQSENISRSDHANIHYALGKMYADIEDYDQSFDNYTLANQLQYAEDLYLDRCFNAQRYTAMVDALISAPLTDHTRSTRELITPQLVFLVGLPRSGKTLIEQVLSAHPNCRALGESKVIFDAATNAGLLPLTRDRVAQDQCAAWGQEILDRLGHTHQERVLTFTLPEHIRLMPVISTAFPTARIIFCSRDPLDLALSCYFKDLKWSHNYSNRLQTTASVLTEHRRLVDHFQTHLHLSWKEIHYEAFVEDPSGISRHLVPFVGLDYRDELTRSSTEAFDIEDAGPVRSLAVKSPLSPCFVGLWRHYESQVLDLMTELGQNERAIEHCQRILSSDDPNPSVQLSMALARGRSGDRRGALSLCDRAMAASPPTPRGPATKANIYRHHDEYGKAIEAFWQALSIKPNTLDALSIYAELKQCIESINPKLAQLHADVAQIFRSTRQSFGDFGMLYQSFEPLWLPGHRPSKTRYDIYRLDDLLYGDSKVLDIGCNAGFMSLISAERAEHVEAFDIEETLVNIGDVVRQYLAIDNVTFSCRGFHDFKPTTKYDLIFSFAVHRWIGLPMQRYAELLDDLLTERGAVVFESQGVRSHEAVEKDLDQKIACLTNRGMKVLFDGEICDDGIHRRQFYVLRKTPR